MTITIDEADLTDVDREFLYEWASNLNVPVEELLKRILLDAIRAKHFIDGIPDNPND